MEQLLLTLGFEGELSGKLLLYTFVEIIIEVIILGGVRMRKSTLEQNSCNDTAKQALQVISWVRTSFVRHMISKMDKIVTRAINKATSTAEVILIQDTLSREMLQCCNLLDEAYNAQQETRCAIEEWEVRNNGK